MLFDEAMSKAEKQDLEIFNLKANLAALRKENAELYDFNSAIYVTINDNFIIQNVNFQAALFIGIDRQQLINKLFLNFITINSKNNFEKSIQKLLQMRPCSSFRPLMPTQPI